MISSLSSVVARVLPHLSAIPEQAAGQKPAPNKWSKKEILGHLIDSAANNHQRFIRLQLERDINLPGSWGLAKKPEPKAKRFSVSYQLLAVVSGARVAPRVRLQVWCDDGDPVPSVVSVWPTADWHEREAYDLMGIAFEGHPGLKRILMDDDWEGHPLRKDYPIGGEPVRFSGAE